MDHSLSTWQPSLLLVDDDSAMIRIIGDMLAEFPDQRFATTGETALAFARESTPDLILLDANLPNMTGFDVCEILKKDAKLARVPVIFVTSHDAPALEVDAFRMGASDYVIKPLVAARLHSRVRAQLRPRRRVTDHRPTARSGQRRAARAGRQHTRARDPRARYSRRPSRRARSHRRARRGRERRRSARPRETQPPGAIVLDARCCVAESNAPQIDAVDAVVATLRLLGETLPHVPVIVLSEQGDIDTEQCVLDAGAADFIAKPAWPSVLQARMRCVRVSRASLRTRRRQRP